MGWGMGWGRECSREWVRNGVGDGVWDGMKCACMSSGHRIHRGGRNCCADGLIGFGVAVDAESQSFRAAEIDTDSGRINGVRPWACLRICL